MSKLKLVRLGHPALRKKSKLVTKAELATKAFQDFLDELVIICDTNNGVGIAAPQVGVNQRVIVVHVDPENPRYKNHELFPTTVIINPKITSLDGDSVEGWEGDLSCGFRAMVPRPTHCVVKGLDRTGKPVTFDLTNSFHARVFQHEIDHLNGVFLIDRVKRFETVSEIAEWEKYWKHKKNP